MARSLDYNTIARVYDRRYEQNNYDGVEAALLDFVGEDRSSLILEVGCGTGYWMRRLENRGFQIEGLDISKEMLSVAKARLGSAVLRHGRAERLPWPNDSFDRIFCINSLHHFSAKDEFVNEARRLLHPGGGLMIVGLDPHTGRDRWSIYDYFEKSLEIDKTRYPPALQVRSLMTQVGFRDCRTDEAQHIPACLPARLALEQGRLDRAVTSQLTLLTDDEYEQGIARLRSDLQDAEAAGRELNLVADLWLYATTGWAP